MHEKLFLEIKKWIKKNNVLDVLLFGSSARGKNKPNDIDLCIMINDKDEEKSLDLIDSLGKVTDKFDGKVQINILTSSQFLVGNTLSKTLLTEGFSVLKNKSYAECFSLSSKSLFIYDLKDFSASKRVKFHYLLRGRYGAKGALKELTGEIIGSGTIAVPTKHEDALIEIFDFWHVKYKIERVLIS